MAAPCGEVVEPWVGRASGPRMSDERELIAERERKVAELRGLGRNPYANGFTPTHTMGEIVARFEGLKPKPVTTTPGSPEERGGSKSEPQLLSDERFTVAGRIVAH